MLFGLTNAGLRLHLYGLLAIFLLLQPVIILARLLPYTAPAVAGILPSEDANNFGDARPAGWRPLSPTASKIIGVTGEIYEQYMVIEGSDRHEGECISVQHLTCQAHHYLQQRLLPFIYAPISITRSTNMTTP